MAPRRGGRAVTRLAFWASAALALFTSAVYAGLFMLAAAVVVRLAGAAGTGAGSVALAIGALVPTCVAAWISQPYLQRVADAVTRRATG